MPVTTDPIKANVAIATALGLYVDRIPKGGVTLTLAPDGPRVEVTYRLIDKEIDAVAETLKQYKLVPIDGAAE